MIGVDVAVAGIALEHSRREVGLDGPQRRFELLEVRHFACHQEVERRQHVFVVGELHQVFVDDLGARFGGYVRTQIDRQVAVGIDVGALPRHAVAVGETRTAARQYAELRIDRKGRMDEIVLRNAFAEDVVALGRILQVAVDAGEQHLDRGADDFEVAQLFGGDIHQHVVFVRIGVVAGERLHEILHRGFQLAVAAAELFEQQPREAGIGS